MTDPRPVAGTAVVTGASSGIGAATSRRLASDGFAVICVARRTDRITSLADEIGGRWVECDVTEAASVARLAGEVGPELTVLVNNAGGAFGLDTIADSDPDQWQQMFELNVLGTLRVTQALLPALIASGDGLLVNMGSTAGHEAYAKGGGYTVAKTGVAVLTETLRQELLGQPVRITELVPGMVRTEEFSVNRLGDAEAAAKVYAGVEAPLTADDIADCIGWIATRPQHVNIDRLVVKPRAQASQYQVHRDG